MSARGVVRQAISGIARIAIAAVTAEPRRSSNPTVSTHAKAPIQEMRP